MNKSEKNLKSLKISLILNIITVFLAIIASIIMFTGFKFMNAYETVLETSRIGMLKFFTVESNLFMGITALLFIIEEIKLLKGKIENIPVKIYSLKLMATTSVGLTFFVVFAYLGPISKGGIGSMLMNSNLFFHLIIPVISMINFVSFEKTDKIKFKNTFYGLIPTVFYGFFYLANILIHMENGRISPIYDWYWFVQNGVWTAIIVAPMMIVITYMITLILWKLNKKKNNIISKSLTCTPI